ncbi:MAG: LysM peptidoglycan-binding domain-containing protein [Chloroflexota bacterium]|nr:LysM peptidoglycan-binding domain-containing protein [Chloroflexota bacterium]
MTQATLRWMQRLSVLLVLLCAGCFRSMDESSTSIEPSVSAPLDNASVLAVNDPAATPGESLPPITLIAPATDAPSDPLLAQPALTLVMLDPVTSTPQPQDESTQAALPTISLQIITPGVSLGLLTPDATALPTRTASALVPPTPRPGETAVPTSDAASASIDPVSADGCLYTVEAGDSLYSIAVDQDTTVTAMSAANPELEGDPPILQIGQELNLPACVPGLQDEATEEADIDPEATDDVAVEGEIYIVQSGDVLGAIASRFGVSVRAIVAANNLANPDSLSIGQELIIPPPAN